MNNDDQNWNPNSLLQKYGRIWLWSILGATNAALTLRLFNVSHGNWGSLGIVLILPQVFALMSSLQAWLILLRLLRTIVLPVLFSSTAPVDDARDQERLVNALRFIILCAAAQMLSSLIELGFSVSRRF